MLSIHLYELISLLVRYDLLFIYLFIYLIICRLFKYALSNSGTNEIGENKLERMPKEVVVTRITLISGLLPGGTEKNDEKL